MNNVRGFLTLARKINSYQFVVPTFKRFLHTKANTNIMLINNYRKFCTDNKGILPTENGQIKDPVEHANSLLQLIINKHKENEEESKLLAQAELSKIKSHISDQIEILANVDLNYVSVVLFEFLKVLGGEEVSALMRGSLNNQQATSVLADMAHREDWRETELVDLMSSLMVNWTNEDIKNVIAQIPLMPISQNNYQPEEEDIYQNDDPNAEADFMHPSSIWGYTQRVKESEKLEESRERVTMDIPGPKRKGVILTLPYKPLSHHWFPDELGALIGRIYADEWELDYITYLLTDIVTDVFAENASKYRWQDYLGYMGVILSASMAIQRHWENEDIIMVYKVFCYNVGRWALFTWENFRELEYREWLADIISMVATRRNDHLHDIKLINGIMEETCIDWDYHRSDYLGMMIESRFKTRRIPFLLAEKCLQIAGVKKELSLAVHGRSLLWSPDEPYCLKTEWEKIKQQENTDEEQKQLDNSK